MGDRTEAPTGRKLDEARGRGQVARSVELNTAAAILAGIYLLRGPGTQLAASLQGLMQDTLAAVATTELTPAWVTATGGQIALRLVLPLGTIILGMMATGIVTTVAQTGPLWAGKRLGFDLSRLDPIAGFGRIFSGHGLMELARALLKLGVVGWVAYSYLSAEVGQLLLLGQTGVGGMAEAWSAMAFGLAQRVGMAYLMLAAADYAYQRWTVMRSLRMTKEEVKEDAKSTEGDPMLRGRIRQQQRRLARQRMFSKIPKADVVITNPTHFAVALQYDRDSMAAPRLVAKGANLVAQRIKDMAREYGVTIVENPPLARALFRSVEIDHDVPPDMYAAMAEVLAYVYSLKARRTAPRALPAVAATVEGSHPA